MATIIRATIAYWALLFTLRVIGRRAVNQMTPFEFILLFLIGGMTIQAIVYDDRSLTNALLAVIVIALNHVLVAWLKERFVTFRKLADGTPIIIVENGHWHRHRMLHAPATAGRDVRSTAGRDLSPRRDCYRRRRAQWRD